MIKTIVAIPCDSSPKNQGMLKNLLNSLRHFHPDLDIRIFDTNGDPNFWYRATPTIALQLFNEGYERIIKMDADQIVVGSLEDILNDETDFDAGLVFNDPSFVINLWDIHPYFNNGLVVLRSKAFVEHWLKLCMSPHFNTYQFREQDLLNILASDYMNYKIKPLDGLKVYGECAKPFWPQFKMVEGKVVFDDKQLCVIHFGGGNTPDKGNYRLRFAPDVVEFIETLI